jgi:hypothetical protein
MMNDEEFDVANVEYEEQLEEIRGETQKKPKMAILNQKKLSKWEMDSLFLDKDREEDYEEEF